MPGIAIIIPGSGPGEGPTIPTPLYSLDVDDYAHRWSAARLDGGNGSGVNRWEDAKTGLALTSDSANKILRNPGASAYIEFPAATDAGLAITDVDLGDDFTYMLLFRRAGGLIYNQFLRTDRWNSGVAGNGSWQLQGVGFHASGAVAADAWHAVFGVCCADVSLARTKVNGAAPTGPGGITDRATTFQNTVGLIGTSFQTGAAHVAELVIWKRPLTTQEMADVYAAVQAGHPLY